MLNDELETASVELAEAAKVFIERQNWFNQLLVKWKKENLK